MQVDAAIFRAYDIRGVVGRTLDEAVAEHLGRAFGTEALRLGEKAVAVGRDGRLSARCSPPRSCVGWRRPASTSSTSVP